MYDGYLGESNATRRFSGLVAVNDVSFKLNEGEILGVDRPTTVRAKTTLVSLISGTLSLSSGDIAFEGRSISSLAAFRRARLGIGRTFQIMHPFPGLSVLDNVAIGALFGHGGDRTGSGRAREQARAQLEFVGLSEHADQRAESSADPDANVWSSPRPWPCSQRCFFAMKSWPA